MKAFNVADESVQRGGMPTRCGGCTAKNGTAHHRTNVTWKSSKGRSRYVASQVYRGAGTSLRTFPPHGR